MASEPPSATRESIIDTIDGILRSSLGSMAATSNAVAIFVALRNKGFLAGYEDEGTRIIHTIVIP